jgi:hypothetical protein
MDAGIGRGGEVQYQSETVAAPIPTAPPQPGTNRHFFQISLDQSFFYRQRCLGFSLFGQYGCGAYKRPCIFDT